MNFFKNFLTKRQYVWLVPLGLLLGVVLTAQSGILGSWDQKVSAKDDLVTEVVPMPVNVELVQSVESYRQVRSYTGNVRAKNSSELGFELSGRIASVFVDEGDSVQKGQVLAALDRETLLAQKAATDANLQSAKAVLQELNAGPRSETLEAAKSTALAAKSQLEIAQINMRRRSKLNQSGAISREEYDQAVFAEKTARANYEAASQRYREFLAGTREEKIAAQRSSVARLEAMVNEVDVAISKCSLIAPFNGTVTRRFLDPGSIAPASAPVIKLVSQDSLEAWVGLPVSTASKLSVGDTQKVLVADQIFPAIVVAKIGELDVATRTQTVLFKLDNDPKGKVVSGQLCQVQIESEVDGNGFWIPTSALSKGIRGLWSVMVLKQDAEGYRVEKRDIEIINTENSRVLARGTLTDGDRIVIDGVHRIAENQLVSPN